jgi:hypothetical protein
MIAAPKYSAKEDPAGLDFTQSIFAGLTFPEVPKNDVIVNRTIATKKEEKIIEMVSNSFCCLFLFQMAIARKFYDRVAINYYSTSGTNPKCDKIFENYST